MRFFVMFVTAVCVLFLFKLRWPKKKNFYDTFKMFSFSVMQSTLRFSTPEGGGGGATPLYWLYRYVQPQRVWFFRRFGHK